MNVDLDVPDPSDRTMQLLEMVEALDEFFPRSILANASTGRDGWPLGWLDLGTGPAGALTEAAHADAEHQAVTLPWREDRIYCLLRPRQARERWARVLPRYPLSYAVEAIVLTASVQAGHGCLRRWQVLTVDERPVMLTDPGGANPRPWLLQENCVYDLDHDIDYGWRVWAREESAAAPWPQPHRPG